MTLKIQPKASAVAKNSSLFNFFEDGFKFFFSPKKLSRVVPKNKEKDSTDRRMLIELRESSISALFDKIPTVFQNNKEMLTHIHYINYFCAIMNTIVLDIFPYLPKPTQEDQDCYNKYQLLFYNIQASVESFSAQEKNLEFHLKIFYESLKEKGLPQDPSTLFIKGEHSLLLLCLYLLMLDYIAPLRLYNSWGQDISKEIKEMKILREMSDLLSRIVTKGFEKIDHYSKKHPFLSFEKEQYSVIDIVRSMTTAVQRVESAFTQKEWIPFALQQEQPRIEEEEAFTKELESTLELLQSAALSKMITVSSDEWFDAMTQDQRNQTILLHLLSDQELLDKLLLLMAYDGYLTRHDIIDKTFYFQKLMSSTAFEDWQLNTDEDDISLEFMISEGENTFNNTDEEIDSLDDDEDSYRNPSSEFGP